MRVLIAPDKFAGTLTAAEAIDQLFRKRRHLGGIGQLEEPEAIAALDDDVEAAVREPVGHLDHGRECPDATEPVVVREHEPERLVGVEALRDQLAIARLEDVERHLLGREQDEAEREEPDLLHGAKPTPRASSWLASMIAAIRRVGPMP